MNYNVYRSSSSSSSSTFTYLICLAFGVSLLGLGANLMHLLALMNRPEEFDLTHPILKGGSSGNSFNSRALQDLQTEEQVFARLLKESVSHVEDCHAVTTNVAQQTNNNNNNNNNNNKNTRKQLGRFGFMNALNNQLSSSIPSSSSSSSITQQKQAQCYNAPLTACQVTSYSMIVTSSGTNLRILFLNLLSWITYANVARVVVILPPQSKETVLAANIQYGQRLLAWDADSSHKITLQVSESLWTANYESIMDSNNNNNNADADADAAIVWMNGDVVDKGNQRGLDAGLELWKRHATAVVASRGYKVTTTTTSNNKNNKNNANNTSAFCKHDQVTSVVVSDGNNDDISIPNLHGLLIHRNYLCFLSHPVLHQLHRLTDHNLEDERVAIAMLLQQLSINKKKQLLLFPPKVRLEGTPEQRQLLRESAQASKRRTKSSKSISMLSRILLLVSSSSSSDGSEKTTRRFDDQDDEFPIHVVADNNDIDDDDDDDSVSHSRRLSSSKVINNDDDLDIDFVTSVAGFFGSLPTTSSIGWCVGSNSDCSRRTNNEEVPINWIPWMSEKCSKGTTTTTTTVA